MLLKEISAPPDFIYRLALDLSKRKMDYLLGPSLTLLIFGDAEYCTVPLYSSTVLAYKYNTGAATCPPYYLGIADRHPTKVSVLPSVIYCSLTKVSEHLMLQCSTV